MKQITFLLTILIILTGCDFKSAIDNLLEAEKLEEQGKYQEAILLLDKAIEKDNKYIGAYINRGADKSALENYNEAIADYKTVLKIDSKNTLALFNIGNNYKRLEKFEIAIEYYNKAFDTKGGQTIYIDYTPNSFVDYSEFDVEGCAIHYERGIAYFKIDSLQMAFKDFSACINKNYMTKECYYWIGHIYLSQGQNNLACENLYKSKQLGGKDAEDDLNKYCNK